MQNTSNGDINDISQLVTELSWDTIRVGKASELAFSLVVDKELDISEGSIIYFKKDDLPVFFTAISSRYQGQQMRL